MRLLAVALAIAAAACALPRELVAPEYAGADAAVVHVYHRPSNIMDWYLEVNGEVAAAVPDGIAVAVRVAPGEKIIYSRMAYNTYPQSLPLKIALVSGGEYYLFQDLRLTGLLLTVRVSADEFAELQKDVSRDLSR